MKYAKPIVTTALLCFFLFGCSSKIKTDDLSELALYEKASVALQRGSYRTAITYLEDLDKRYPYGPYSQQAQLDLIYAYYKSANLDLALAIIDRFIKLNPMHPDVDYVYYLRGLINVAFDENSFQGLFGVDRSDRDPANARIAFNDFNYLITNYPDSIYRADAEKRLVFVKNRLAKYQLSIMKYYNERKAYVAVVKRGEEMMINFPDTQATRDALEYMLIAYEQLGLTKELDKVKRIIDVNK